MATPAFSVIVEVQSIKPSLVRYIGGAPSGIALSGFLLRDATQGTGYYSLNLPADAPANTVLPLNPPFRGSLGGTGGGGINLLYDPDTPTPSGGVPLRPTLTVNANLRLVTNIDPLQAYYGSYEAFQALYPGVLGQLPIFGQAPQTFASTINVPYYENPTAAQYLTGPGMFIDPAPPTVLGQVVSTSVGGGTLTGVDYTDANGDHWTSVDWQWQMIADRYQYGGTTGFYRQQVIQYTGDGTSNRLIPTALDLTVGNVVVWVQGGTVAGDADIACMRHTGMTTTNSISGDLGALIGITALQAAGFRVTVGAFLGTPIVNATGIKYTAVIMQDTTSDNRYLSLGSYAGNDAVGRVIPVNGSSTPTHVWVFGRSAAYKSVDIPGSDSLSSLHDNSTVSTTTGITAIGATSFTVGAGVNVNASGLTYYYAVLKADAAFLAQNLFRSFSGVGAVTAPTVVTGLGFTPSLVMVEKFTSPLSSPIMFWRGPDHTGTSSSLITGEGGHDVPTQGIVAVGAGSVSVGNIPAPAGVTFYGYAWAGGTSSGFDGPSNSIPEGNSTAWISPNTLTNPDGSGSTLETTVTQQTMPTTPGIWVPAQTLAAPQWWCNASLGQSVYQSTSPGAGWVACVGPISANGWYFSTIDYGGQVVVVSGGKPADPRTWTDINVWATANTGMLGGAPAACCVFDNTLIYPATGYTVGTTYPPIRVWDGRQDRELCRLPPTPTFVVPKAVVAMLSAGGSVYFSTFDAGTTSTTWSGRVMQLDPISGQVTPLGTAFAAGELPYALAWHMGRLWCGTNNGVGTVGKVYFFRPGIDTTWTLDHSLATDSLGGVDSMISYLGKLYVGSDNAGGSRGKILVRDTAGAYTVSETGSGGTAIVNNGYLAMCVFNGNLYASYWNNDSPAIAKIRKFDGSSWSTVYTGSSTTIKPYILLFEDHNFLYAIGGGKSLVGAIISSANGTSWTNLTSELPPDATAETLLPMYGTVIS